MLLPPVWCVQANADQLQLVLGPEPGSCLQLEGSAAYQMPVDDAVGPLHLTPVRRSVPSPVSLRHVVVLAKQQLRYTMLSAGMIEHHRQCTLLIPIMSIPAAADVAVLSWCFLVRCWPDQGVCKYLSAMTSFKWASGASSRGNSSNGASEDNSNGSSSWLAASEELRRSMRASRGKQMLELVETLGGKPVSMKVCSW
jgi:hypothetical protein